MAKEKHSKSDTVATNKESIMLTVILSFVKNHLQSVLIASGVVSVLATISLQHLEIHHLQGKLSECHAEGVTLENSNKALLASIEKQNAAVTALAAESQNRKNMAAKALAQAKIKAGRYDVRAGNIKATIATKDDCADLRRLVSDFVAKQGSGS